MFRTNSIWPLTDTNYCSELLLLLLPGSIIENTKCFLLNYAFYYQTILSNSLNSIYQHVTCKVTVNFALLTLSDDNAEQNTVSPHNI